MKFKINAIIVSFKRGWIIENCIKSIEKKTKIIVVENSNDYKLKKVLEKNSKLVLKVFEGKFLNDFILKLKKHFKKVERYKSKASRERSKEIYLICS